MIEKILKAFLRDGMQLTFHWSASSSRTEHRLRERGLETGSNFEIRVRMANLNALP
jgi:hypothetical protein